MSLTVRKTGSASLAYQQWADYTVYENGRAIGSIYEDRATRPALWRRNETSPAGKRGSK